MIKKYNIEEITLKLLKKFKKQINSILFYKNEITLIVSDKKSEIKKFASKLNYPINVELAEKYFKEIIKGDKKAYSKISDSAIIYDPTHLIDPIKEMILEGEIIGTKEFFMRKFTAIDEHFRKINLVKLKVLDNIYTSVIEVSQALLIEKQNIFCTQREAIKNLKKYFVSNRKLEKKYLEIITEIITTFKDIEHKKTEMISGKEIDKLQKKAGLFRDRILELLEK
ncbi:MAG: hypothetical protein KJ559_01095 [Nanoarchaeota archaeon]|nr:hypothetical protein [Nanoarchaeota archaeon]